jgi:hypothetical protein
MDQLMDKIKEFFRRANDKGIPTPMLRDPETDQASVSLTMLFISFNTVLIGLVGKFAGLLGGINLEQAIYFFMVCCGLYFGRKVTSSKNGTNLEQKENKDNE